MKKNSWLVMLGIIAALVLLFCISFWIGSGKSGEDEEGFVGTDSVVVDIKEKDGAEPRFEPIFEPGSGEIESGLFALQAALGAGVVGFVFGNLRGRHVAKEQHHAAPDDQ